MSKFKTFVSRFYALFLEKHIFFNASAITFNVILCSVPFSLVVTSLLGFVLTDTEVMLRVGIFINDFFPSFFMSDTHSDLNIEKEIVSTLQPLVERRGFIGAIGFGILAFTSLGLFESIKHVLFDIFNITTEKHPVSQFIYNFFALGVAGGVFIVFSIFLSFFSILAIKEFSIPAFDITINVSWLVELLAFLLPFIFNLMLFYVFFRYVSERKIERKTSFFGAALYTLLFEIAKFLFGVYLSYFFLRFQNLYQSYAIIIMIGLWAFYAAITFTISAVAARSFHDSFMVAKEE